MKKRYWDVNGIRKVDVLIIGGGAAGLMAAAMLVGKGLEVLLVEKNKNFGCKLLLTGKGRCNITNMCGWEDFKTHIHPDSGFLKNSFYAFSNEDVRRFFESVGVETKVERGNRLFPVTDRSATVRNALEEYISKNGIDCLTSVEVLSIEKMTKYFAVDAVEINGSIFVSRSIVASNIIVATGGLSYPRTGCNGSGYLFAEKMGHTVSKTFPSLTALKPDHFDTRLIGIHLKNVSVSLLVNGAKVAEEMGEMDFTDNGLEGAIILRVSRRAVTAIDAGQNVSVSLDLKPALTAEQLARRVSRDTFSNRTTVKHLLVNYLPSSLILPFIDSFDSIGIPDLPVKLKNWKFRIVGYVGYERCVITAGGISLKEVSRKNMESKLVPGLFFAGEVLDLDGDTGGYNLQIAFSTAAAAANGVVERFRNSDLSD